MKKYQTIKHQIPSTKYQTISKNRILNFRNRAVWILSLWILGFFWNLGFGIWNFPQVVFAEGALLFSDVPADSSYFLPTRYLKEKNLIEGYSDGSFHPDQEISRAEALAMILKTAGVNVGDNSSEDFETTSLGKKGSILRFEQPTKIIVEDVATGKKTEITVTDEMHLEAKSGKIKLKLPPKTVVQKSFDDVSPRAWYFNLVKVAKARGLVNGKNGGKNFAPKDPVNLAEGLQILFKAHDVDISAINPLPGLPADAWYAKNFGYAVSKGILLQQENGQTFPPEKTLTRGQLALLLYRFLERDTMSFGYASWYGDGLAKTKIPSGHEYKAKNLTAAHLTLPFGTIVHVTNMANGKTTDVVVNDRGPYVTGRIIDLSKSAFAKLDDPGVGIVSVQVEVVSQVGSSE